MENTFNALSSLIPADLDILSMLKFIALFAGATLLIGFLGRIILGKRSGLNHAVSSAMGILFIYALTIVLYVYNPGDLAQHLAPLPFITFSGNSLILFRFQGASFPLLCSEILSMVILAFLVNLLDTFLPKGKKVLSWYFFRFLTVLLAIVLHAVVTWLFNTYLPDTLVTYAPMILLGILLFMLLLGILKVVLGLVLAAVNPVIAALYAFFFSNIIGKQLGKAVLTTVLLCLTIGVLTHFGFGVISIAASTLGNYIPLMATLLLLWYLVGHIL